MNKKQTKYIEGVNRSQKTVLKSLRPIFHDITNGDHIILTLDQVKILDFQRKNSSDDKNHLLFCVGIFIPTLITLPTVTSYGNFLTISGESWRAVILILLITSFLSACFFGFRFFRKKPFSFENEIVNKK